MSSLDSSATSSTILPSIAESSPSPSILKPPTKWVHRLVSLFLILFILVGLGSLTIWNLTRSDALEISQRLYVRGDLVGSLREALSHLDRRPWSREAALYAARCLSRLDYADVAEPYFLRAGKLSLDDLQLRAYGIVRANHREQAVQAYEEILERWPENALALRRLAAVRITQNDDAAALELAEHLIKIPTNAAIGYTLKGVIQHNDKNQEAAVLAFEKVLDLDPELKLMPLPRTLFWSHLANDLVTIGRVDDARRYLTQAVASEPSADLIILLARAHDLAGATEEAVDCFAQAASWDPISAIPPLYLGKIALRRGNAEMALKHLSRALELSPRDYDIMYTLSLAYRQLGRASEADGFMKRAERLRGKPSVTATQSTKSLPRYAL